MTWVDFEGQDGESVGLDFLLAPENPRRQARFRIEATSARIALSVDGHDHAFARLHPAYRGLWLALADRPSLGLLPPLDAPTIRALPRWGDARYLHEWTRFFARSLATSGALDPGRYALTAAADPRASRPPQGAAAPALPLCPRAPRVLHETHALAASLTTPARTWRSWWLNGSGEVFRLRAPPRESDKRVRSFRKRVRDGSLPPILLGYVSGLDLFALLDGHDRLAAATLEGTPPPVLVLWRVREEPSFVDPVTQEAVLRRLALGHQRRGRPPLSDDRENQVLLRAFPPATYLYTKSLARPLRGGAAAWEARVRATEHVNYLADNAFFAGTEPNGT